jgi:2-dehydropantoate 2-reductase
MKISTENFKLQGLTSEEAAQKLKKEGYNELSSSKPKNVLQIALGVVKEPMFMLLVACGTLCLLLGDIQEGIMLMGFVFVIMGIEFFQEKKTEKTLDALKDLASPRALVIRDGENKRIMAKILIIGAGVIGSVYGGLLAKHGNKVTFLARKNRLAELKEQGLILKWLNSGKEERISGFEVKETLSQTEKYDFIFVTVRRDNLDSVYPLLRNKSSANIVFMVNNPNGSAEYRRHIEKERIILGFPGAGGEIKNGKVFCHVVSGWIQPTTIGEITGQKTKRILELKKILKTSGFPVEINTNMNGWLINHLAMVCPLANAIYADGGDNFTVATNKTVLRKTAVALKEAFRFVKNTGIGINPPKFRFFLFCPARILSLILKWTYNTEWAKTVICNHALNAKTEMRMLSEGFLSQAKDRKMQLPVFEELAAANQNE